MHQSAPIVARFAEELDESLSCSKKIGGLLQGAFEQFDRRRIFAIAPFGPGQGNQRCDRGARSLDQGGQQGLAAAGHVPSLVSCGHLDHRIGNTPHVADQINDLLEMAELLFKVLPYLGHGSGVQEASAAKHRLDRSLV